MNRLKTIFTSDEKLNFDQTVFKKTAISFFIFFVLAFAAYWGWKWFRHQPQTASGRSCHMRTVLDLNEKIFSGWLSDKHLAKEYPKSMAANPARVNGNVGLTSPLDTANWAMHVIKSSGDTLRISMDDIRNLPKTEIVFNFKCIEGWSQITHWGGVRFSEFVKAFDLDKESTMKYLGLATPDQKYYVGIDMPSAMHPQTLLCYELNGQPLPLNQGYPLRLIITVKYGVKSLKRIGYMYFDEERPRDYWAERGYDYYIGL